jgi:hypothetical protein
MFRRGILLIPALLACAYAQGTTATRTVTQNFSFPPAGLASSETAQVNVANIAPASTGANAVAPACTGTITFANAAGATLGSAVSFTTTSNQIFSKQLAFNELDLTGIRGEFVATVQITTTFPSKTPCAPVLSLETFDSSTGATHIFQGNSASLSPPRAINSPGFSH